MILTKDRILEIMGMPINQMLSEMPKDGICDFVIANHCDLIGKIGKKLKPVVDRTHFEEVCNDVIRGSDIPYSSHLIMEYIRWCFTYTTEESEEDYRRREKLKKLNKK